MNPFDTRIARRSSWTALLIAASLAAGEAWPVEAPAETCEQIRARVGRLPPPDAELLRTLALRRDCGFTSAEFYRAAYGDRPPAPPRGQSSGEWRGHGHEGDEEDD